MARTVDRGLLQGTLLLAIFLATACRTPAESRVAAADGPALATAARGALERQCAQCPGAGSPGDAAIDYITDLDALVSNGKVKRGTPEQQQKSRILVRLLSPIRPMPPPEDDDGNQIPRSSAADIESIRQWVLADSPTL